jgi:hypothetical protein
MYEVQVDKRTLKFDGVLLAFATSYRPGAARWIEFTLYRTMGGSYVLARVGETRLYHTVDCTITQRSSLVQVPRESLKNGSVPCDLCHPQRRSLGDDVFPELPRHWAQTSETAESIVENLYRYDENGGRYLTSVAERLLEEASKLDPHIEQAYRIETIL